MVDFSPVEFTSLMALESWGEKEKGTEQFVSRRPAFTGGNYIAYGGHVYAQAVWAASLGVLDGMVVHVSLFPSKYITWPLVFLLHFPDSVQSYIIRIFSSLAS